MAIVGDEIQIDITDEMCEFADRHGFGQMLRDFVNNAGVRVVRNAFVSQEDVQDDGALSFKLTTKE